ncbi:attachment glycoprotein [Bat paramyxovirus]|uniref:attachment glycoprotein n=1 Tax=Bat paramyxovirus TaxID=1300978 RepID=UPI0005FC75AC|nr:attachment glycoprotein [Bat paramyxovirus]AIF74191.1 attachment glycoprotein [Bat paramyxovirus]
MPAAKTNVQKYFNDDPDYDNKSDKVNYQIQPKMDWFNRITGILGLISLVILILLNITTLIKTYSEAQKEDVCLKYFDHVEDKVTKLSQKISQDVQPRISLITTSTSYTIPSMLDNLGMVITNEIDSKCSNIAINMSCPEVATPIHDLRFNLLNTRAIDKCLNSGGEIKVSPDQKFENYPSFVPASTVPNSCTRYPSFSLSATIFAYSHTLYPGDCDQSPPLSQTWLLGYISSTLEGKPEPKASQYWIMDSSTKKYLCSTVAGSNYGWLGCATYDAGYIDDLHDDVVRPLTISYMDTKGRRNEWTIEYSEIKADMAWGSMFFSTGSGVIIDGYVHFLVYGTLKMVYSGNVYCKPLKCKSFTQQQCNDASFPSRGGGRQFINGILTFVDNPKIKPTLVLSTFSPSLNWQGNKGRLIYDSITGKVIINTKAGGWNPYLQIGFVHYGNPLNITWVPYPTVARPGTGGCGPDNDCPRKCYTGSFNDAYPLRSDLTLVATSQLNPSLVYKNPDVETVTPLTVTGERVVFSTEVASGETSTTCFMFDGYVWCMSLIENANYAQTNMKVTPFLYQLITKCEGDSWWTSINKNTYLKHITPFIPERIARMLDQRTISKNDYERLRDN